jgi:hypothetical protein
MAWRGELFLLKDEASVVVKAPGRLDAMALDTRISHISELFFLRK